MNTFKTPQKKLVKVRVFSKEQKEVLFDLFENTPEIPKLIGYTSKYIDYEILFNYAINLSAFLYEYKSIYFEYKFKILSIKNI